MKKYNVAYILIMSTIVLVCILGGNYKTQEISTIDNRFLTEFPQQVDENFTSTLTDYTQDRIAFRNVMIRLYNEFNNRVFQIFPDSVYGENGHLFGAGEEYIASYQHLNGDDEYADYFVDYMSKLEKYCNDKKIEFIYMLCPDKTTVYPEYMPKNIGVYKAKNLTELIKEKIIDRNIRHVFVDDLFLQYKENSEPLFYKRFDIMHWSDYGHYLGVNAILKEFALQPLSLKKDFEKIETIVKKQLVSEIIINDELTLYKPNSVYEKQGIQDIEMLELISMDSFGVFKNSGENLEGKKRLLLLGDSYLGQNVNFWGDRFSEIVFVHAYDIVKLQMLINLFKPDMVVFENVERVMDTFYPKELIKSCDASLVLDYSNWNAFNRKNAGYITIYTINDEETYNQCEGSVDNEFWIIKGTALNEDNIPGTGIYAKVGNEIYTPDYYIDGAFKFTLNTKNLIEEKTIEFLLVDEGEKVKYEGVSFDIYFD